MITKMVNKDCEERPTCDELLSKSKVWSNTVQELQMSDNYINNLIDLEKFENKFFFNYFSEKKQIFSIKSQN
jgi:hypothetical protein